jgi:hypothetical protein
MDSGSFSDQFTLFSRCMKKVCFLTENTFALV